MGGQQTTHRASKTQARHIVQRHVPATDDGHETAKVIAVVQNDVVASTRRQTGATGNRQVACVTHCPRGRQAQVAAQGRGTEIDTVYIPHECIASRQGEGGKIVSNVVQRNPVGRAARRACNERRSRANTVGKNRRTRGLGDRPGSRRHAQIIGHPGIPQAQGTAIHSQHHIGTNPLCRHP